MKRQQRKERQKIALAYMLRKDRRANEFGPTPRVEDVRRVIYEEDKSCRTLNVQACLFSGFVFCVYSPRDDVSGYGLWITDIPVPRWYQDNKYARARVVKPFSNEGRLFIQTKLKNRYLPIPYGGVVCKKALDMLEGYGLVLDIVGSETSRHAWCRARRPDE